MLFREKTLNPNNEKYFVKNIEYMLQNICQFSQKNKSKSEILMTKNVYKQKYFSLP